MERLINDGDRGPGRTCPLWRCAAALAGTGCGDSGGHHREQLIKEQTFGAHRQPRCFQIVAFDQRVEEHSAEMIDTPFEIGALEKR